MGAGGFTLGLAALVSAASLSAEVYARAPRPNYAPAFPNFELRDRKVTNLVVILHGLNGPDKYTKQIARSRRRNDARTQVVEYDYKKGLGDQLRAPYNAMRVGKYLAGEIKKQDQLLHVHIIAFSVGAFAADCIAVEISHEISRPRLRLTFLDPFTARSTMGLLRPHSAYGVKNFGKTVDASGIVESVFNRDDPVPSTNLPLRHAVNFDVTSSTHRKKFFPSPGDSFHSWPAAWYSKKYKLLDIDNRSKAQRGSTVTVLD